MAQQSLIISLYNSVILLLFCAEQDGVNIAQDKRRRQQYGEDNNV